MITYTDPRSLDPKFLKPGDIVAFGSGYLEVRKAVAFVNKYNDNDPLDVKFITFDVGSLYFNDPLWKLARKV